MLKDADAGVRAAAVRALAAMRGEQALELMRRTSTTATRAGVTAAAALAGSRAEATTCAAAEAALGASRSDAREPARRARREVAAALGDIRNPRFRPLLVPLDVRPGRATWRRKRSAAPARSGRRLPVRAAARRRCSATGC